jgi:hypothetical protein
MAIDFMKVFKGINFAGQASAPSSPANGDTYYDTTLQKLRCYQNGAWVNLSDSDGTVLLDDGTVSAPSLAFINETGLGLYRKSAGVLAIAQGGVDLITFDTSTIKTEEPIDADKNIYIGLASDFPSGFDGHLAILRTDGTGSAPFNEAGTGIYRSRVSSTAGRSSHLFYTGSPTTLAMSIDQTQKITIGASGGTQTHIVNGGISVSTDSSFSGHLNILGQKELRLQDTTGGEYVGHRAPGTVTSSHTYTWPAALPVGNTVLQSDSSGNLSWVVAAVGDIVNGGNSFGAAMTIGTNDAFALNFETNAVTKGSVSSAGLWTLGESGGTQSHVINGNAHIPSGNLRVGTTGLISASIEQSGILQTVQAADTASSHAALAVRTTNAQGDCSSTMRNLLILNMRTTTADTTDTNYLTNTELFSQFTPSIGTTYTNSNRVSQLLLNGPQNLGAGSLAISNASGIRFNANSTNSGTRKTAISFGAWSGATNNAYIADNEAFTGDWFINSTSTAQTRINGSVGLGANPAAGQGLRVGHVALTGTAQIGILSAAVAAADATSSFSGISSSPSTANSAFTCGLFMAFNASNTAKGAASTITRHAMYYGAAPTQGTNNAFIADNASFTGDWFINSTNNSRSKLGNFYFEGVASALPTGFDSEIAFLRTDGTGSAPFDQAGSLIIRPRVSSTAGRSSVYIYTGSPSTEALRVNEVQQVIMSGAMASNRADVASAATITALSSAKSFIKLTGSTITSLQGIQLGVDGQRLTLVNLTGQNLTIAHENAGATAANRITTMTGADVTTTANGAAEFIYDTGSSRWICLYVTA